MGGLCRQHSRSDLAVHLLRQPCPMGHRDGSAYRDSRTIASGHFMVLRLGRMNVFWLAASHHFPSRRTSTYRAVSDEATSWVNDRKYRRPKIA